VSGSLKGKLQFTFLQGTPTDGRAIRHREQDRKNTENQNGLFCNSGLWDDSFRESGRNFCETTGLHSKLRAANCESSQIWEFIVLQWSEMKWKSCNKRNMFSCLSWWLRRDIKSKPSVRQSRSHGFGARPAASLNQRRKLTRTLVRSIRSKSSPMSLILYRENTRPWIDIPHHISGAWARYHLGVVNTGRDLGSVVDDFFRKCGGFRS
jgi:hypothetical protein